MPKKVYRQEVTQDTPFPGEAVVLDSQNQSSAGGNYSSNTTRPKSFKRKVIANELLASALNTRSRKILGEFQFTPSGALQVGDFKSGVSGDLRISPDGITGRDLAGLTTFALDGTSGDAVFKGTVQAGSFISGSDNGATVGPAVGVNGADFNNIQEGIDFINDLGGGTVFIQSGTYTPGANLNLHSNITLLGEDNDTTVIDFEASNLSLNAVGTSLSRFKNIHLRNIQIKGSTSTTRGGVFFQFVDDFSVTLCKFKNNHDTGANGSAAIWLNGCLRGIIKGCHSDLDDRFVFTTNDSNFCTVKENQIENSYDWGIELGLGTGCIVLGNYIDGSTGGGIQIDTNARSIVVDNIIGDIATDMILVNTSKAVVSNNTFFDSGASAIAIRVLNGKNIIASNNISANNNIGIHIDTGNNNIVSGNVIADIDGADGLLIDNTSDKTITTGNQIGVRFSDNGTNTSSSNNVII